MKTRISTKNKVRLAGCLPASLLIVCLLCISAMAAEGDLDTTFNGDGRVTTSIGNGGNDDNRSVAIQSDGKIVMVGETFNGHNNDFAVIRYNTDGSLDTTFGDNGKAITSYSY